MAVDWNYFDKFEDTIDKYMPMCGEGFTLASQIVTAVNKIIYKWYNDGDVYDNTGNLDGWCNDISSFANWLAEHCECNAILDRIYDCFTDDEYEDILQDLADLLLDEELLSACAEFPTDGSIYKCDGRYKFVEEEEDDYGY